MISERTANAIAVVVTAVWLLHYLTVLVTAWLPAVPDYEPPGPLNAVFGLVVGAALTLRRTRSNGNGGRGEER